MAEFFEERRFVGMFFDDGEAVVFDRHSHATHALDAESASIYSAALATKSDEEATLRSLQTRVFSRSKELSHARIAQTLAELRTAGLLEPE